MNGLSGALDHNPEVLRSNPAAGNMESLETESLIKGACDGDADGFCELCRAIETRLLRQAMSLCGDATVAEDLAQETLVEGWKSLRRYNGRCQLFTWLCAIMLNRYRNIVRQQRSSRLTAFSTAIVDGSENRASQLTDQSPLPDEVLQRQEQAALMYQCIRALPQKHREVIYLRFYVDNSLEGIAAALGCSLGTVKSRLFHALEKLRGMNALSEEMKTPKQTFEPHETLF